MSDKDISISSGEPVEFYLFDGPFGQYRYTTSPKSEMLGGSTYLPLEGLSRTAIETGSVIDTVTTNDVNVPCDCDLALLYNYGLTPKTLSVTVYRAHRGDDWSTDFTTEWVGQGTGYRVDGNVATIETGSLVQSLLSGGGSSVFFQRVCNHVLFDARCKVNRSSFTAAATVTLVRGQFITVDNDFYADGDLAIGVIKNLRTGEERGIVDNTSNKVKINYAFIDIIAGDSVELTLGCDHLRLGDCTARFNNVVNYGGFDFIPSTNPFEELDNRKKIITMLDTTVKKETWMTVGSYNSSVVG